MKSKRYLICFASGILTSAIIGIVLGGVAYASGQTLRSTGVIEAADGTKIFDSEDFRILESAIETGKQKRL